MLFSAHVSGTELQAIEAQIQTLSRDPCQTKGTGVKVKGIGGETIHVVHVNEGLFLLPAPAHYANPGNSCVMRGGLELPCVSHIRI
jgi:hypothetical protein